jgi:phage terminase large subunit GpA-like protein
MGELLIGGLLKGLKPEPVVTVDEWANTKRKLSSKGSAEPGQYNVNRVPFLRKIMRVLSMQSGVWKVILMKGTQLGATEVGFNLIGYCMEHFPCPIMYLMPTVQTMERNVKQRINPMIEECPSLLELVGKPRSRDGGNTLAQKDFPGGALFLTGANSAAGLSSIPVKVAIPDEVDRYPDDVDDEGDPVSLVIRRMATFGDRKKLFMPSSPTIEGASRIEREFLQTDQQYYYVPCPHCEHLQTLVFEQLKWETGKYHDVHYQCISCEGKIYNRHKTWMLRDVEMGGLADWRVTCPENINPKIMGFHVNSLYSPDGWMSWEEVAEEWDKSEGDEPKRKALINTILAKTYKVKGEAPPWQQLFERAQRDGHDRNAVWDSVAVITAGADVQADRIEVIILGWMKGKEKQMIDYRVLPGDTTKPEVWAALGEVLEERWLFDTANGAKRTGDIGIKLMAVDANYNAAYAHAFAKEHGLKRVIPIQGREDLPMAFTNPKVVTKTKIGKNLPKGKVWPVGTNYLKELIYGWLRQEIKEDGTVPKGYFHFLAMNEEFFRGITAEERVQVRNKKSHKLSYEWITRYDRNEPLDTTVYATAAAYVVGIDRWNDARWDKEVKSKGDSQKQKVVRGGNVQQDGTSEVQDKPAGRETPPDDGGPGEASKPKKPRRSKGGFWN